MNWFNKHFRKSKCIKVIYFGEGKKHYINYIIPNNSTVTMYGKTFMLNKEDFFIDDKNFVTYVFSFNRVEPVDPNNAETLGTITPEMLNVALDSNVASQILSATKNKADINMLLMVMIGVMILGFGALWYTLNEQIAGLYEILEPFRDVFRP